jgi:hypothetical protein
MKKVLFLLATALAVTLVAATTALAQEPQQATIYPDGVYDADGGFLDADANTPGQQISQGFDYSVFLGWVAANRGLARTAPRIVDTSVAVLRDGELYEKIARAQARHYWTGVLTRVDWATPFNPRMGTRVWSQTWLGPIGVLPTGHYIVTLTSTQRHTTTDLLAMEYGERLHHPTIYKPPAADFEYSVAFDVVG